MSTNTTPTFKVGLTPEEKQLYAILFKNLDSENSGIITGEKARTTFEKSGLPPTVLGEIWQISDPKNLGFLTQFGFCHAMRLIGYTQAGQHPTAALADYPGPLPKFADMGTAGTAAAPIQPQSTSSSFMQSQPSSIIPQNTATGQFQPQDPIATINPQDYQKFSQLFIKTVGSPDGDLAGTQARNIFMKAKLPTATLGQIWNLVDRFNVGKLNLPSFVIAMHLIQGLMSGQIKQLPPFLPENVWQSVELQLQPLSPQPDQRQVSNSSMNSQQTTVRYPSSSSTRDSASGDWVATPAMIQQYDSIFNSLDKSKSGQLDPDQVASFLVTSKLNQQDLATIWDLSDIQNTGIFTKLEFSIALFLVNKKLAGQKLPNIIPDSLISSLKSQQQSVNDYTAPVSNQQPQQQQQQPQPVQKSKSSIDDLADIFGTSQPAQTSTKNLQFEKPTLETRSSSSDLSHHSELPKVRNTLTGSFKPTSSFGQQLLQKQQTDSPTGHDSNLLGDDVSHQKQVSSSPAPSASPLPSASSKEQTDLTPINYDALRSVPPPPPPPTKRATSDVPPVTQQRSQERVPTFSSYQNQDRSVSGLHQIQENVPSYGQTGAQPVNRDLLADPNSEYSGQLSQGSTDIANVSNQIKSLTSQTTQLHDNKSRAEQELQRVLSTKKDIEGKLTQLRTSYENEVKQVEQVESNLKTAKEETEALRSEASISEAKLNALSTQLHEKQLIMEDLQKQNSLMTEKLGTMNAEIVDLQKQVETNESSNDQLSKQVNVKRSQVQVVIVKHQDLRNKLAELESHSKSIEDGISGSEAEHSKMISEHQSLLDSRSGLEARYRSAQENQAKLDQAKKELEEKINAQKSALSRLQADVESVEKSNELKSRDIAAQSEHLQQLQQSDRSAVPSAPDHSRGVLTGTAVGVGAAGLAAGAIGASVFGKSHADHEVENSTQEPVSRSLDTSETTVKEVNDSQPEEVNNRLSNFSANTSTADYATNATGPSSFTTNAIENETPVTSPDNSEFQFPQNNGLAGGISGIPNVQRTDSLTSSVQNNAAMSVRDDNIDVSDREIDRETILSPSKPVYDSEQPEVPGTEKEDSSDKFSSGVESFEMVNAEEATQETSNRELDNSNHNFESAGAPTSDDKFPPINESDYEHLKQASAIEREFPPVNESDYEHLKQAAIGQGFPPISESNYEHLKQPSAIDQEFPPIKEMEYDESSSEDDTNGETYDDANDDFVSRSVPSVSNLGAPNAPAKHDDFDGAFADLEPATPELNQEKDMFADEFDNLEIAKDENAEEEFLGDDFSFSNEFTNEQNGQSSTNRFVDNEPQNAKEGNDEWEQLFAGFGNSQEPVSQESKTVSEPIGSFAAPSAIDSSKDQAIHELVGMGFDENTAIDALKRENWNLVQATNYLLDNA